MIAPASRLTSWPRMLSPTKLKCASFEPLKTNDDFNSDPGPRVQWLSSPAAATDIRPGRDEAVRSDDRRSFDDRRMLDDRGQMNRHTVRHGVAFAQAA